MLTRIKLKVKWIEGKLAGKTTTRSLDVADVEAARDLYAVGATFSANDGRFQVVEFIA